MSHNVQEPEQTPNGALIVIVDKITSRASTQEMLITLALPMEKAVLITPLLGKLSKHVAVAFADLDKVGAMTFDAESSAAPAGVPAARTTKALPGKAPKHEHGDYARELFRKGFFRAPKLHERLGLQKGAPQEEAAKELALTLGYESMGEVSPKELLDWARENELTWLIPSVMRDR